MDNTYGFTLEIGESPFLTETASRVLNWTEVSMARRKGRERKNRHQGKE